jgi:hypothetical protein
LKLKRILSLFTVITLLAGLFVTPAFADSGQSPPLQQYLDILGQPYSMALPDGKIGWAHFDRGQLVYGFPGDVTGGAQGYDQDWKMAQPVNGQDWDTANASDATQAPSGNTDWASGITSGLQHTGSHPGQEPRYIGYNAALNEISNENFPPDTTGIPIPAQCVLIKQPWTSVSADPNYQQGNGWPAGGPAAVCQYTWGVIGGQIQDCYEQFGFTAKTDSFTYNSAFSAQNGNLSPTNIENYFELLTMPEPGITGSVRFWNTSNGEAYYKTISIPWTVVPNYYVEPDSITPFSGTQTSPTATVNGQTAAVYNNNGAQNTYTGTVTFGAEPDPISSSNAGSITYQLWQLMSLPDALSSGDIYSAPVGVCVNSQDNFATIKQDGTFVPDPAAENAGGPNEGISLGNLTQGVAPGTYTATFTWSIPQGFSGTSMPIGAGINDGFNDYFNQTTDIMPPDVTYGYADPYECDLSDNFTYGPLTLSGTGGNTVASDVPVVGATQPQLLITPSEATIQEGATQQYTDQYYPNGVSQGDPQDVTTQSLWSDGYSAVASIGANTGLATGEAQGTTTLSASYTPIGGSALSDTAGLAVQQQQQPGSGSTGTLTFRAYNQANIQTLYGQRVGGTLKRGQNIALWTDSVTATLAVSQPPTPTNIPQGGSFAGFINWGISSATLDGIPIQNSAFTFDNPVEPSAYKTLGMNSRGTVSSGNATAVSPGFEEDWSEDGIGYGTSGPQGIMDALTGQKVAVYPKSYQLSATYVVNYTYDYTYWVPGSLNHPGHWATGTASGSSGSLTASQRLWVCGTGAVPVTGTGGHLAVVACLANPQTHP